MPTFMVQYVRAGNSLNCSSLIRSFAQIAQIKWATVSDLLRSLRTNERLWANRSGCSWEMSDHERFAQVAHDKWANERVAKNFLTKSLKSYFLVRFLYVKKPEQFAHSLFFNEWYEQFAQVAHQKWVTMIDLLRSLTKTEQMSESLVFLSKLFIPLLFRKNERFI